MTTLPTESKVPKVRCTVCREEHLKKELQQHRQVFPANRAVFRCSTCDGDYLSKEELWDHQDLCAAAGETEKPTYKEVKASCKLYKCLLCTGQRVYQESAYWEHLHECHDGCNEGFGKIRTKSASPAEELVATIKCECPVCDHVLPDWNLLSKHMETDHQMIVCSICTMVFSDDYELQAHKCSTQSGSLHNVRRTTNSVLNSRNNGGSSKESDLEDLFDSHHNVNTTIKMEISVEETELHGQENHSDRTHLSEDLKYNEKIIMEQGINVKEEPLEEDDLIEPMDSEDSSQYDKDPSKCNKDYQGNSSKTKACKFCGLKFPSDTRMRYHRMITHTNPRYKCSKCPKVFHVKHMLARHETTHLQQENITCSLCSETYRNELRLQRHLNCDHSVPCDLCELRFTTSTIADRHKRKHHKDSFPKDKCRRVKIPGSGPKPPVWNSNQLQEAITAVVTQQTGISQASKQYNVPKGTLYDNILGKGNRMAILHELVLSENEEDAILNFACSMSHKTHSKRTKQSLSSVLDFMSRFGCFQEKAERFKFGGIAAFQWWWAFCRKHSIDPPRSLSDGRRRGKFDEMGSGGDVLI